MKVDILTTCIVFLINFIKMNAQNPFMKKAEFNYRLGTKTPYRLVANMDASPFTFKGIT